MPCPDCIDHRNGHLVRRRSRRLLGLWRRTGGRGDDATQFESGTRPSNVTHLPSQRDLGEPAALIEPHDFFTAGPAHENTVGIKLELPGAGIADFPVGVLEDEQSLAIDSHVEIVAGLAQLALLERQRRSERIEAESDLAVVLVGTASTQVAARIEQICELEARTLEARCIEIGRVVRNHAQAARVAQQARHPDVDGFKHGRSSGSSGCTSHSSHRHELAQRDVVQQGS
jgi:hypothetical protein